MEADRRADPAVTTAHPVERTDTARLATEVDQLRRALESRGVIDRAQGMIMALTPCPADRAWQVLVEISQHGNTKLRDVAAALVATADGTALPSDLYAPFHRAVHAARTSRPSRATPRHPRP
ncbi:MULTISPECIES: ANTAR domain-containing protein [unclassified Streptomyces]|uniref:ANTAR domain-containing protein n=1 Tax=unclassified Streptomyces TaxID=2593676 RepID=UPI0033AF774C